jgi:hypothetical protein
MWVTDLASLWAGRRVWGLPKNLAEFAWKDSTVRIADGQGLIATIKMNIFPANLPPLWMPTLGMAQTENGNWLYTVGHLWARLGRAGISIEEWSPRFGYRPNEKPAFSFAASPFRLHLPAPKLIR